MSLLTYADARESASRIQEALASGTMPPWFADPATVASALEFILEGLHLSRKLNKDVQDGHTRYRS